MNEKTDEPSLTCILMKEIDKKIFLSNDKFLKFEKFISDEPTRWIILFISVMIIYIYMLYISYTFIDSQSASQHKKEAAMLFNPSLGGNNKVQPKPKA